MDHQSGIDLYRESAIFLFHRLISCAEWAVSPGIAFNGVWSYNEGSRNSTLNWRNLTAQTFTATLPLSDGLLLEHNTTYYSTILSYNRGVCYIIIIGAFFQRFKCSNASAPSSTELQLLHRRACGQDLPILRRCLQCHQLHGRVLCGVRPVRCLPVSLLGLQFYTAGLRQPLHSLSIKARGFCSGWNHG